jgi:hypothetical protein
MPPGVPGPPAGTVKGGKSPAAAQIVPRVAVNRPVGDLTVTKSRAVLRTIDPGNSATCSHCGTAVKFVARAGLRQVIANVYESGVWARVEHYHEPCYGEAGAPHGEAA